MATSFWITSSEPSFPRLEGTASAEIAVVGGSFAGLSVAHHLAAAGRDVVVLERDLIGSRGARAAGILASSLERDLSDFRESCGEEVARRVWRFASEGVSSVESLCQSLGIAEACRWSRTPSFYFFREADRDYFEAEHELRLAYGFRSEIHSDIDGPLAARGFRGAIVAPDDGLVDPFELSRSMALAISRTGRVRIHERSGMVSMDPAGRTCTTEAGTLRFEQIVLAGQNVPSQFIRQDREYAFRSYCLVTEPLSREDRARSGLESCPVFWDSEMPFFYGRMTPDGRLLVGGSDLWLPLAGTFLEGRKERLLVEKFRRAMPSLASVPIARVWGGDLHLASDTLPRLGRRDPGLVFLGNCAGISQAVLCGKLAADLLIEGSCEYADLLDGDRKTPLLPALSSPLHTVKLVLDMLGVI